MTDTREEAAAATGASKEDDDEETAEEEELFFQEASVAAPTEASIRTLKALERSKAAAGVGEETVADKEGLEDGDEAEAGVGALTEERWEEDAKEKGSG